LYFFFSSFFLTIFVPYLFFFSLQVHLGTLNHTAAGIMTSAQGMCKGASEIGPSVPDDLFDYFVVSSVLTQVGVEVEVVAWQWPCGW
jgi:hypothetical protein